MNSEIGALWAKEKKQEDGTTLKYFSGIIETLNGTVNVAVFPNVVENPEKGKQYPDFRIVKSRPLPKEKSEQ